MSNGNDNPLIVTYEQFVIRHVLPELNTAPPGVAASTEIPDTALPFRPDIANDPLYVPFANTIFWPAVAFASADDNPDDDDTFTVDDPAGIGGYGVPSKNAAA